jgi:hypothetical protein
LPVSCWCARSRPVWVPLGGRMPYILAGGGTAARFPPNDDLPAIPNSLPTHSETR